MDLQGRGKSHCTSSVENIPRNVQDRVGKEHFRECSQTKLINLPSKSGVERILSGTEMKEKVMRPGKFTNIINWKFCKLVSLKLRRIFEGEYFVMSNRIIKY